MPEGSSVAYERVRQTGLTSASPVDLLAIVGSRRESDVGALGENAANKVLRRLENLRDLLHLSPDELRDLLGLDAFEVLRFQAALELGRRAGAAGPGVRPSFEDPQAVYDHLFHQREDRQEHFWVFTLDAKLNATRTVRVHTGTVSSTPVGVREVFREAVREGAVAIVVAHNHPSGDPEPSPEDLHVTRSLAAAGKVLEIELLDHVIIARNGYVSFRRRGLL